MAKNNATILAKAWLEGTNDFQQHVPDPTQSGAASTMKYLFNPMNRNYYNEFMDFLVKRIAYTKVEGKVFDNPLAPFKKDKVNYGNTIQQIAFKWLKAHTYSDVSETLLKTVRPEGVAWYHSQNRRDRYDISIMNDELRNAVTDEMGLSNIAAKITELPANSDNYDEFQIMKNLLSLYESEWGFHREQISAPVTDEATGKEFLTKVMADAGYMKFPSTIYNNSSFTEIPTFITDDELILITTPTVYANLNVQTYASMFNMDVAKAQARIVLVDNIPIPGAIAIQTTRDIFEVHDTVFEVNSFFNPEQLGTKYYLHHWGIYSINPFVPAVLYTTGDPTTVPEITQTVTGMGLAADSANARLGDTIQLHATLQGTIDPATGTEIAVRPSAATYSVVLNPVSGETSTSALNSRTWVDYNGVLHIQRSGLENGDTLTVYAASTYVNPTTESTDRYSANTTITIGTEAPVINPTSVTVAPATASVAVDGTQQFTATVLPVNASDKTGKWSSSAAATATVDADSGLVTGVAAGTANIVFTTTTGAITGQAVVTVTA